MQGIAAVQARIAAIEARFVVRPPVTVPASTSAAASPTDFDAVLRAAVSVDEPVSISTGQLQPPAELVQYGNGRVPAEALSTIGVGQHRLYAPAAAQFRRLLADAAADGVQIGVTDSYRDLATQERLAVEKGLYSQGGLAARPGTSPHGWGLALDLDLDASAQAWMRANGARYGFVEDVPREPWHWTYRAA